MFYPRVSGIIFLHHFKIKIIQQSWKTYHLKHILILNLKPGCIFCCICPRYCLLPGRKPDPQPGLDVRGTQIPENPATHRGSCAAEQLRMPVEPCVLGCSHLRMIRDRQKAIAARDDKLIDNLLMKDKVDF